MAGMAVMATVLHLTLQVMSSCRIRSRFTTRFLLPKIKTPLKPPRRKPLLLHQMSGIVRYARLADGHINTYVLMWVCGNLWSLSHEPPDHRHHRPAAPK